MLCGFMVGRRQIFSLLSKRSWSPTPRRKPSYEKAGIHVPVKEAFQFRARTGFDSHEGMNSRISIPGPAVVVAVTLKCTDPSFGYCVRLSEECRIPFSPEVQLRLLNRCIKSQPALRGACDRKLGWRRKGPQRRAWCSRSMPRKYSSSGKGTLPTPAQLLQPNPPVAR